MEYIKIVAQQVIDDGSECVCGKCEIEEHTCPFAEEIHGDYESLCNCCAYCCQQCAWEI